MYSVFGVSGLLMQALFLYMYRVTLQLVCTPSLRRQPISSRVISEAYSASIGFIHYADSYQAIHISLSPGLVDIDGRWKHADGGTLLYLSTHMIEYGYR